MGENWCTLAPNFAQVAYFQQLLFGFCADFANLAPNILLVCYAKYNITLHFAH